MNSRIKVDHHEQNNALVNKCLPTDVDSRLPLDLIRSPVTLELVKHDRGGLITPSGQRFEITSSGIPLFASDLCSDDARIQQSHYDTIAAAYLTNLEYPHTQEYMAYLDRVFLETLPDGVINTAAEICCGRGDAFILVADRIRCGVGVDVSVQMLEAAMKEHVKRPLAFIQGDATTLPLANGCVDAVFMLGGIHHVRNRLALFSEVARILKPGGHFYWREPVSDFFLWRWLRALIYKVSPLLDADTERPLLYDETVPVLERVGLELVSWKTYGFFGFCIFMNSDVLVFNRLFRFIPGIRHITRLFTWIDDITTRIPGLRRSGLQVVGVACKSSN
jgi:SAM-dependent methyltransferase